MSHHRYLWALRKDGTIARLGRVLAAQAKIKAAALARSLGASVMISKALPNPRQPAPGESWVGPGGEKVKVTSVGAGRVVVLGASGSRRSIDPLEFRAVWRPATARLNARRNLSGGRRSSRARRTGGGSIGVSGRKRRTCNPKGRFGTAAQSDAVDRLRRYAQEYGLEVVTAGFLQHGAVHVDYRDPKTRRALRAIILPNGTVQGAPRLVEANSLMIERDSHRANPKRRNVTARRNPEQVHGGPGRGPGRAPARSIAIAIGRTTATATATASPTVHSPTSTSTSTRAKTSTDTDTSTATDTRSPSNTTTNRRRAKRKSLRGTVAGTPAGFVAQLLQNADDYHLDRITHKTFSARNLAIWRRVERAGLARQVTAALPRPNRRRAPKSVRRGRNRKGRFVKGNPRSERARALRTRARWHDHDETTVRYSTIKGPPRRIPKTLVRLGAIHSITYESDKYAGSKDNPTGRQILYEHATKRPRPVLATDPDGRHLHIVGGKMRMTADGLVN